MFQTRPRECHIRIQRGVLIILHQKSAPEASCKPISWPSNFLQKTGVGDHFRGPFGAVGNFVVFIKITIQVAWRLFLVEVDLDEERKRNDGPTGPRAHGPTGPRATEPGIAGHLTGLQDIIRNPYSESCLGKYDRGIKNDAHVQCCFSQIAPQKPTHTLWISKLASWRGVTSLTILRARSP